jgi:hypothetical protein
MSYINWTKLENEAMNSLLIERDEEIATLKKKIQHLENNMQGTYRPIKDNLYLKKELKDD